MSGPQRRQPPYLVALQPGSLCGVCGQQARLFGPTLDGTMRTVHRDATVPDCHTRTPPEDP